MLTKEKLDDIAKHGCQAPDCDHASHEPMVYLHSRCHVAAGCEVSYRLGDGFLTVGCAKCHRLVAMIAVADQLPREE